MPTEPPWPFWRKIAVCGSLPANILAPANARVPQGQAVEPVPSERERAVFDQVGDQPLSSVSAAPPRLATHVSRLRHRR